MLRVNCAKPTISRASRKHSAKMELRAVSTTGTIKPRVGLSSVSTESTSKLQARIQDMLGREISFIHSPEFNHRNARLRILKETQPLTEETETKPVPLTPAQEELPAYFAALYQHQLLTPDQEANLFRRMNYLKFRANALRSALKPQTTGEAALDEIERLLAEALQARDQIITSNLRLVVSLARKYDSNHNSFDDLLSEGNITLMRAIEKFDYSRGFRFSTYATYAIQYDFFRLLKRQQKDNSRLESGVDELADSSQDDADEDILAAEEYRRYQTLLRAMQGNLDDRDRRIVMMRFGIDHEDGPQTLQTIGQHLGLSKERVRQLEIRAIARLKQHVEDNR